MRIIGIIIIIVVLGFFGGYRIIQSQIDNHIEDKETTNIISKDKNIKRGEKDFLDDFKGEKISKKQAEAIVFENADVKVKDISSLETKIENYYGKDVYDIEFNVDNKEYNYNVDMYSGEILSMDYEIDKRYYAKLTGNSIDEIDAIKLVKTQIPNCNTNDINLILKQDDGFLQYEGKVKVSNILYEFTIDKNTGTFIEWKWENYK